MQSAPASIPPITAVVLEVAFAESMLNLSSSRSYRPADSASRITGTRPAADARFESSKTGRML